MRDPADDQGGAAPPRPPPTVFGARSPGRPGWPAYFLAAGACAATMWVRLSVIGFEPGDSPMIILFILPILLGAYVGGLGVGLLSTLICAALADYYLLQSTRGFSLATGFSNLQWLILIASGTLISVLTESLRRSRGVVGGGRLRRLLATERKVQAGFAVALVSLATVGAISYFNVAQLRAQAARVARGHDLIASLRQVLATMMDAEASQRGYTIAGDEKFLAPYDDARRRVDSELMQLRRLTMNDADQRHRFDRLELLVAERLRLLGQNIELRRAGGFDAAREIVTAGAGKALQDQLRAVCDEIESDAQALLRDQEARAERASKITRTSIAAGGVLAFVFCVLAMFAIGQDFAGSRAAEAALRESRDRLEEHVRERTEQLARANESLRFSERRFAGIISSAMDGIVTVDEDQRITLFNDAAEKLFGYHAVEMLGQSLERLIPPRFNQSHRQHVREFAQTGVTRRAINETREISGLRANGEEFPIEASVSQIEVSGQKLFTVILRDTTERKRAEMRLRAFADLGARLSVASSPREAAEIIVDVADNLFGWDACKLTLYWREKNELVQVLTKDIVNGERAECPPDNYRQEPTPLMQEVIGGKSKLILKEGSDGAPGTTPFGDRSRRSASIMFAPIRQGSTVMGIVSIHSYTLNAYDEEDLEVFQSLADHCGGALNRVRAEAALRESELRFSTIFRASPVCIAISRLSDGVFVDANDTFLRTFGYTREEMIGHSAIELNMWPDLAERERMMATLSERGRLDLYEARFRKKNGESGHQLLSAEVIELNGERFLLGMLSDVTERRMLEAQLRQVQKMEAIGQLAGGVAHDFNNILSVIQGYCSLLVMEGGGPLKLQETVSEIELAVGRAANLTQQLLAFSRRQTLQPRDLEINDVISSTTKMLKRLLREDISLQVVFSAQPLYIRADPGSLDQVLINLAVNARDAMPQGGRLVISTAATEFDEHSIANAPSARVGSFVCVSVSDTGAGIPKEIQSRIFEPFFTTKDVGKGTGLGLATVYGIVQQHGGWINLYSEVDRGTTFRIYFPRLVAANQGSVEQAATGPAVGGSETILLAEDEPALRALVKNILSRLGYRILEAATGAEALEIWKEHRPEIQLLLTDLVMPDGMSGIELARRLRREDARLRVIYTSGYSPEVVNKEIPLQEGFNFLAKPFHPRKLAQTVRARLDT